MKPSKHQAANKEAKIVGRSTTVQIFCFSLIHYVFHSYTMRELRYRDVPIG